MNKRRVGTIAGVLGLLTFLVTVADAHHSNAMFDAEKTVVMQGVVKDFQYSYPHAWLVVEIANADGTMKIWGFEGGSPGSFQRQGVRPGDLAPGTKVTVTTHPMRDGRSAGSWIRVVRESDGKIFPPPATPGT